ncbi:MAG: hypothetical protein L3J66_05035 [Bacteroidales bacterium]|nr:hypothetical protein [Bacteroidales bacterium]
MKKNKFLLTGIFITLFGLSSFGQGGGIWNFDWDMGFALGSTKDFIDQPSFRGFSIEGRGFVTDNMTIGGQAGWQTFYQSFGWVTEELGETGKIYGYKRRYLNFIPIMASWDYYFMPGNIMPYVGLGLGTYYIESRNFMGIYYLEGRDWHFGLAPEVGVAIPFGSGTTGVNINFKYNWAAATKDNPSYSWLGINIGLSYIF